MDDVKPSSLSQRLSSLKKIVELCQVIEAVSADLSSDDKREFFKEAHRILYPSATRYQSPRKGLSAPGSCRSEIVRVLSEASHPVSMADLVVASGKPYAAISQSIVRMLKIGLIERPKRGFYQLAKTDAGADDASISSREQHG